MKYTILSGLDISDLIARVNAAIKKGWKPYGNPFADAAGCHQAMTKK